MLFDWSQIRHFGSPSQKPTSHSQWSGKCRTIGLIMKYVCTWFSGRIYLFTRCTHAPSSFILCIPPIIREYSGLRRKLLVSLLSPVPSHSGGVSPFQGGGDAGIGIKTFFCWGVVWFRGNKRENQRWSERFDALAEQLGQLQAFPPCFLKTVSFLWNQSSPHTENSEQQTKIEAHRSQGGGAVHQKINHQPNSNNHAF